jgi:hypothetical protein
MNGIDEFKLKLSKIINPDLVDKWMETPNPAFSHQSPIELILDGRTAILYAMLYELESGQPN